MKKLGLTSLEKALTSLQKAIERYGREPEDEEVGEADIIHWLKIQVSVV